MHSATCGVGATSTNTISSSLQTPADGVKMVHNTEDPMNKIPLKSASGMDDEEKNGGEFIHDTAAAEEARREQMRANLLSWMKKLTIGLICFIGLALITYVIVSLCFSDWPKSTPNTNMTATTTTTTETTPKALPAQSNLETNAPISPQILPSSSSTQAPSAPSSAIPPMPPAQTSSFSPSTITTTIANANAITTATTKTTATTTSTSESTTTPSNVSFSISSDDKNADESNSSTSRNGGTAQTANLSSSSPSPTAPQMPAAFALKDKPDIGEKFTSILGVYEKAAVCSDREVCSEIGRHILDQDGSAVDSAIATLLCVGILTMQSMGIGGGMLMNVYIKEAKRAYAVDGREVAPFAAYPEMFENKVNFSEYGGLTVAVPGEVMGYYRAHERFGKLPWSKLVEPSIKLCHEGFYMTNHHISSITTHLNKNRNETPVKNIFINPETGKPHPVGTKIHPPKELCNSYTLLAENGAMDFYNGTLAKLIAEDLQEMGSLITPYDLESYSADLVNSITLQLGNDTLYVLPPVSSGTVVASILSILEGFNFTKADLHTVEDEARTVHRFAEAMKFGFAKRWELGDLRFNDVRELVSKLTNPESNMELRARINDSSVFPKAEDYGAQFMGTEDYGTSHVSVFAPNGDAVSVTSSVNYYFGSGIIGKRTGILFNNGMNDFSFIGQKHLYSLPPAPSNFIDARKRPMSSMSPIILTDRDGDARLVLGAAGGSRIISALVEIVARVVWMDEDIKSAIDAPRFHHQLQPDTLQYQIDHFDKQMLKLLEARGHHTKPFKDVGSVACGITRNNTGVYVNADYRKRGGVAGF